MKSPLDKLLVKSNNISLLSKLSVVSKVPPPSRGRENGMVYGRIVFFRGVREK